MLGLYRPMDLRRAVSLKSYDAASHLGQL